MDDLLASTPLWVTALVLISAMAGAAALGDKVRRRVENGVAEPPDGQQTFVVSAMLGLLALLMGFTFSLAVDRFETRRALVLEEANALGTAYLRVQLLEEPHRTRLSGLIVAYVDNRLALSQARRNGAGIELLAENDRLITEFWTAVVAALPAMQGFDYSSTVIESMNTVIDLDASRKTARQARVPTTVLVVLTGFLIVTAAFLGYVLVGRHGRTAGGLLILLLAMSLLLIVDIDRPTVGTIREAQGPMQRLRESLAAQPPELFDRFREAPVQR